MNASTTKALSLGIVVALWAVISHFGKLPLQLWPVIVGLACFVGAGGGTLYGLNENGKHDERYRNAYAACMHSRGYTG